VKKKKKKKEKLRQLGLRTCWDHGRKKHQFQTPCGGCNTPSIMAAARLLSFEKRLKSWKPDSPQSQPEKSPRPKPKWAEDEPPPHPLFLTDIRTQLPEMCGMVVLLWGQNTCKLVEDND